MHGSSVVLVMVTMLPAANDGRTGIMNGISIITAISTAGGPLHVPCTCHRAPACGLGCHFRHIRPRELCTWQYRHVDTAHLHHMTFSLHVKER